MTIDGHTRVCGLIGDPVEHTSSPAIHNTLAGLCGHNLVYVPLHVERGNVDAAVKGAYALNILGLNVTVPHKIEVMKSCVSVDSLAAGVGAVNTLVRTDDGYIGYNTDILGLERALLEDMPSFKDCTAVLLGAGGAARAAAILMAKMGVPALHILNRTRDKAEQLAAEADRFAGRHFADGMDLQGWRNIPEDRFAVIQATSIGLAPDCGSAVIMDPEFYGHVCFGFDLVYRPADTMFMKLVRKYSPEACTSNGLKMLLYQGVTAYELWNGIKVPPEKTAEVYRVLEETVRK